MKRYQKLLLALAAVATIFVVRETGLDKGLVDDVFNGLVEALVGESDESSNDAAPDAAPDASVPLDVTER